MQAVASTNIFAPVKMGEKLVMYGAVLIAVAALTRGAAGCLDISIVVSLLTCGLAARHCAREVAV